MAEPRVTVLVADDHPLFRDGIARAVRARPDLELVAEVADGRTALERIRELAPAVAVLDLRLPELDGLEVLNAVRRDALPTRVLMLSATTEGPTVFKAISGGAAGYLSKSSDRTSASRGLSTRMRRGGDAPRTARVTESPARELPAADAAATNRGIALLRIALLPLALIATVPGGRHAAFDAVVALFALYAIAMLAVSMRPPRRLRFGPQAIVDLLWIAALTYVTDGPDSPLRFAFYVLPTAAAIRLSPRLTATWLGLAVTAYLLVAVPHPRTVLPDDVDFLAVQALMLLWVGAGAVMLSSLVGRREQRLQTLAAARRELVRQALGAESRERRRLAEALHDGAIQNVLVARQEVTDADRGVAGASDRARQALDETTRQLRGEVMAMHPLGLERAGLGAAVRGIVEMVAQHGDLRVRVSVEDAASGAHDDLVIAIVRELATNVVRHARAATLTVTVAAEPSALRVTVADDGVGVPEGRLSQALEDGHIGVAATAERVRAVGGELDVASVPGAGTTVVAVLPLVAAPGR